MSLSAGGATGAPTVSRSASDPVIRPLGVRLAWWLALHQFAWSGSGRASYSDRGGSGPRQATRVRTQLSASQRRTIAYSTSSRLPGTHWLGPTGRPRRQSTRSGRGRCTRSRAARARLSAHDRIGKRALRRSWYPACRESALSVPRYVALIATFRRLPRSCRGCRPSYRACREEDAIRVVCTFLSGMVPGTLDVRRSRRSGCGAVTKAQWRLWSVRTLAQDVFGNKNPTFAADWPEIIRPR